jgi:NAD(P)-dependent dehydrogenase (short-subunit alcohol dehydrogenase family)
MNDEIRFDGRVVVITGAGNGLGREYALQLASRGAQVVVNDLGGSGSGVGSSHSAADGVVTEIKAAGGKAVANYDSVATRAGGKAIIDTAMDAWGRVDAVINNAGFLRNVAFEDMTDEQLDPIIDCHLKGAFYVSQPAFRIMKQQRYGRLLFTASASGVFGSPLQSNYGAAKAGLVGLMHCVALEGEEHGILANALLPMSQSRLVHEMSEEWARMVKLSPDMGLLGSRGTPPYVAPLVMYLVSEQCNATRHVYSALAGRYVRAFIGVGEGWMKPEETPPSVEEIKQHFDEIGSADRYYVPQSVADEFTPLLDKLRQTTK